MPGSVSHWKCAASLNYQPRSVSHHFLAREVFPVRVRFSQCVLQKLSAPPRLWKWEGFSNARSQSQSSFSQIKTCDRLPEPENKSSKFLKTRIARAENLKKHLDTESKEEKRIQVHFTNRHPRPSCCSSEHCTSVLWQCFCLRLLLWHLASPESRERTLRGSSCQKIGVDSASGFVVFFFFAVRYFKCK